jgi:hypothetical protein
MATFTTYSTDGKTIAATSGGNYAGSPIVTMLTNVFDASKRNLAAADVAEVLNIPAGTYVMKVFYRVLTADATQTLNVGDGADPDGYVAAADVATAGNNGVGGGALATGKYYATADTIDIEVPATKAFDTLKVVVSALCVIQ